MYCLVGFIGLLVIASFAMTRSDHDVPFYLIWPTITIGELGEN